MFNSPGNTKQPLLEMASTISHLRAHDKCCPDEFSKHLFQVIILKNLILLLGRLRLGRVEAFHKSKARSMQGVASRMGRYVVLGSFCLCERTNNIPLKKNASGQSDLGKLPLSQEGHRGSDWWRKRRIPQKCPA